MSKINSSLENWKKSLLDISKRNRAINYKKLKLSTIDVFYPTFVNFLNDFEKKSFQFVNIFDGPDKKRSLEEDMEYIFSSKLSIIKKDEYETFEMNSLVENYLANNKVANNKIITSYSNDLVKTKLRSIANQARLFEEENALNVLYIAVGLIKWYELDGSNTAYYSPLMFIPANLTQESISELHKLSLRENDIIANESLIRLMNDTFKLDFSFDFDTNKTIYENYENYKGYLTSIISKKDKWEIVDEINISTFKFNNINMVKDLEENEDIIVSHNLIKSLAGDVSSKSINETSFYTEEEVDLLIDPNQFYQPLDADSSQNVAIKAAIDGASFVLQGPPGTGKSQTITNIISELIARDKKILFVAEKKAALDVVYNNLRNVGLNEYALTLHNVGLDKKETISELVQSLEDRQGNYDKLNDQSKRDISNSYIRTKTFLNNYGRALLKLRKPLNKSVNDLYGLYIKLDDIKSPRFDINNVQNIDSEALRIKLSLLSEFEGIIKALGVNIKDSSWFGFNKESIDYQEKEQLDDLLKLINHDVSDIIELLNNLSLSLGNDVNNISLINVFQNLELVKYINDYINEDQEFETYYLNNISLIEKDVRIYEKIYQSKDDESLLLTKLSNYNLDVFKVDLKVMLDDFLKKKSIFSRMFSKEYKVNKKILISYQIKKKRRYNRLVKDLTNLVNYQESFNEMAKLKDKLTNDLYSDLKAGDLKVKINKFYLYLEYIKMYQELFNNEYYLKYLIRLRSVVNIDDDFIELDYLAKKVDKDIDDFNINFDNFDHFKNLDINLINRKIKNLIKDKHYITQIMHYNKLAKLFNQEELSDYVNYLIDNNINNSFKERYLKRYYYILINYHLKEDAILGDFNKARYLEAKEQFSEADLSMIKTTNLKVKEIINEDVPNLNGFGQNNHEVITLLREHKKKRKVMPVRKLFEEIPNLILKLKPVLMMSPLSVSTFLRTSSYQFDTVIFDEASQVYPENAIGALYRSKQFIIVGDDKQLPPTSFFKNIDSEDDNDQTDVYNFESILDIAGATLPQISLKWHYRSKFEELITPSNKEIYHNELTTFPQALAANVREGLEFEKVDGIYFNNTNILEANRVVELVFEHFDRYKHSRSLGVVTFNKRQTSLIEDLLIKKRSEKPEYEPYFSYENKAEPFFVKNLENVQGDERDTMIMSVTYGPNKEGRTYMRFGPINNEGGNRRLNVAITRAKYNLIIVSSMTHDDIDLSKSDSMGVLFLKNILKYAQYGFDDDLKLTQDIDGKNYLAKDIYNEISKLGYDVKLNVGTSGYKIDLAVIDPNDSLKHLLGIELDATSYLKSTTTRSRDRLREQVLLTRGWQIYRIWSPDWFNNKQLEVVKLKDLLNSLSNNVKSGNKEELTNFNSTIKIKTEVVADDEINIFKNYPTIKTLITIGSKENRIAALDYILDQCAPIHLNEIKRIIPSFYGREKFSSVVESELRLDMKNSRLQSKYYIRGNFILKIEGDITFRQSSDYKETRDFLNIHPDELKVGIMMIVKESHVILKSDLQNVLRDYSGYQNFTDKHRDYVDKIIYQLIKDEKLVMYDDLVKICV